MSLGAECLNEKTKDLQITASISKEPHIIYKLINILYKMPKDPKTKTTTKKEITNTKHPNQLNTGTKTRQLGGKKKTRKTLTHAPKVKNNRAFPEEKNYLS